MQQEYEYRREVLERTGIVLVDKGCIPLPQNEMQRLALGGQVVEAKALPPAHDAETNSGNADAAQATPANHDDDVTDAEIISHKAADTADTAEASEKSAKPENPTSVEAASESADCPEKADGPNKTEKPQKQG